MNVLRAVFLGLAAALASINWWAKYAAAKTAETVVKPLVPLALIGVAAAGSAPAGERAMLIAGLVACWVGDVALLERVDRFLVGLVAFVLAHLLFSAMFTVVGLHRGWPVVAGGVLVALLAGVAGPRVVRGAAGHGLGVPVVVYLIVISAMAILGWATHRPWTAVGVSAFLLSDTLLGWERFVRGRRWLSVAVMVTYHLALLGITLGAS